MFWRTIGRIIVVGLSLLLAASAALFVLMTLGLERITAALSGGQIGEDSIEGTITMLRHAFRLATAATIVPALLLVIAGEIARIRSALYYVVGGGAALAAIPLLARLNDLAPNAAAPTAELWQVFATAGFAGGLVYWMLAGRRA